MAEPTIATAPLALAAVPTPIKRRMLSKSFGVASFKFNRWSAELDETQSLEDALEERFWSDQSAQIMGHDKTNPKGRGDIIEIRKLDTGLFAELLVTAIGAGFVRVSLLRKQEPAAVAIPEGVPFTTKWNVGRRGHEVIRKGDNAVMAGPFQTKDEAAAWIVTHMKAMAA